MSAAMAIPADEAAIPCATRRTPALALDELSLRFVIASRTARQPVLDFGCSDGLATVAALSRGAHVIAIDSDESAIQQLLARVPSQHHRRLRARVEDLLRAAFKENSFGAIHAARVLQGFDVDAIENTLRNFFRWLHPGGRLYVSIPVPALESAEDVFHREIVAAGFVLEEARRYPLPWDRDQQCCSVIARSAL